MLSDWCYVFEALHGSLKAVLGGPVTCQRNFFSHFRFPSEILSNSDPEFLSNNTKTFLEQLGVKHWVLLTYNPQFSSRTEVALETKRLLQSKTGSLNSCLDKDCFLLVIMKLCNNPDRDCNLSPAQIVFERPINDAFAFASCLEKLINKNIGPLQRVAWIRKEEALWEPFYDYEEKHNKHSCSLLRLNPGILGSLV